MFARFHGLRGNAMATLVYRSSFVTGAAAASGKNRSWAFSKLNAPSTPSFSSSFARSAAPTTELDSITSTFNGAMPPNLGQDALLEAGDASMEEKRGEAEQDGI